MQTQTQTEAAKTLWLHVLYQAMQDLIKPKGKPNAKVMYRESAKVWFNDLENDGVNSFLGICDNLGVDPDKVRNKIFKLKENYFDPIHRNI